MNELERKAKDVRNAYAREWRAKNKDKVKATNKRYWEKKVTEIIERERAEHDNEQ